MSYSRAIGYKQKLCLKNDIETGSGFVKEIMRGKKKLSHFLTVFLIIWDRKYCLALPDEEVIQHSLLGTRITYTNFCQ